MRGCKLGSASLKGKGTESAAGCIGRQRIYATKWKRKQRRIRQCCGQQACKGLTLTSVHPLVLAFVEIICGHLQPGGLEGKKRLLSALPFSILTSAPIPQKQRHHPAHALSPSPAKSCGRRDRRRSMAERCSISIGVTSEISKQYEGVRECVRERKRERGGEQEERGEVK